MKRDKKVMFGVDPGDLLAPSSANLIENDLKMLRGVATHSATNFLQKICRNSKNYYFSYAKKCTARPKK
jgi:hypothetical protein